MDEKDDKRSHIDVDLMKNESKEQATARTFIKPSLNASRIIQEIHKDVDYINVSDLTKTLQKQEGEVIEGSLSSAESMLISQAHTLDAMFTQFSILALKNQSNINTFKLRMNLALKIQNQCRMTLGTLADVKNPKPYIQNNKAQYQQVNNGFYAQYARARTEEKTKTANELLEDNGNDEQWMDTREAQEASGRNQEMETVEEKHRR
jgi:hypothetical protein